MMTGVPAIFHSRTYVDFDFADCPFPSMPLMLREEGYGLRNIVFWPRGRELFRPMMGDMCEEHWPERADPNEFWGNDLINETLSNLLAQGLPQPFFLFLNYNCRYDPTTSDKVRAGIEMLRGAGLLDDALMVLGSDHGYPDPSRRLSFWQRRRFGHDQIMTDDNILSPLIFSYPGCRPRRICEPVSLLDVMPTVLDLLGKGELYRPPPLPSFGRSLLPLIRGGARDADPVVRVDNRYIFQEGRVTALRGRKYKYIRHLDSGAEALYDVLGNPGETTDLSRTVTERSVVRQMRSKLDQQEAAVAATHAEFLRRTARDVVRASDRSVAILGDPHPEFVRLFGDVLAQMGVRIAGPGDAPDLVLVVLTDGNPRRHYRLRRAAERLRAGRVAYVNYNLKPLARPPFWLRRVVEKFMRVMPRKLRENPKTFCVDLLLLSKRLIAE